MESLAVKSAGFAQGLAPLPAATVAATAYLLPYALSRSTSPTPDHPRVLLWYRLLRKPALKPPDIAIPLTWFGIESGLAFAGYRLLRKPQSPERDRALAWLAGNVTGIGLWSRLFFGSRDLPTSTVAAGALALAGAAYVHEARKVDRPAAAAGVPLVAWVCFATVLTAAIWRRNR
jgi:tryptophan-rich sensory protein